MKIGIASQRSLKRNRLDLKVDLTQEDVRPGDLFLLCSDGLNSMLNDREILETLTATERVPEKVCRALVDRANQKGGEDNITVVVVQIEPKSLS